ncbi:uncharacterized protein KZ484_001819 [Pholidichthys leucotaenia]
MWTPTEEEKMGVGAAVEPVVGIHKKTSDGVVLMWNVQCASQKPELQWKDDDGNVLPAEEPRVSLKGDGYYVTRYTTVTKSGRYHCVATQEDIRHVVYKDFDVQNELFESCHGLVVLTGFLGVFLVLVLAACIALLMKNRSLTRN